MTATLPRPRRSALYLPASNAKAIAKSRTLPCDVVILDLEDAVAPEMKSSAREQAVAAVREGGFGGRELVVRVNGLETDWGADDLRALAGLAPDAVLVPKVGSAADLSRFAELIPAGTRLWAMVETALSIVRLDEIASVGAPLAGFVMGTNDLAKEVGCRLDRGRQALLAPLSLAVIAARAHGLVVLDGVYNDLDDTDGLAAQVDQAVALGFDGKTLIHPAQIEPCNRGFSPTAEQVAAAQRIVAAFSDPANGGRGALRVDGRMVERLHLVQAERTLAMAGGGVTDQAVP